MAQRLPHASGAIGGGTQASAADLSEAFGALTVTSVGVLALSASSSDSGNDEAVGAQLLQVKVKPSKKAARKARAKACEEAQKAAKKAKKEAKAQAELVAKQQAQLKALEEAKKRAALCASIIEYFDENYERKPDRLAAWQLLCKHVGVEPGPSNNKCRKAVKEAFINIFDFVAHQNGGPRFTSFPRAKALRDYSVEEKKVFPIKQARDSPILSSLLIDMYFK
ncbi:hypothetical protein B0A54_04645 [Friedmanniomyces endolithicus]|uniref:Uncharacterized protein n=1 Tax=Friedmanniomyces endolithicus TaxID=329885 RepID=A0A4U0V7F7_9PEZI|nr:hypothetical protein B0A54_04645 [Friedmanniomyces endolithicus]